MENSLTSIISVGGRFHAFDLAKQLHTNKLLGRLITSYPKCIAEKWGIPRSKVKTVLMKELMQRIYEKIPFKIQQTWNMQYAIHEMFDYCASHYLIPADIFHGWSSFSLHTMRLAKRKFGMKCVIDRGNAHISYQTHILKEEAEKFKLKINVAHPKIIDKELQEYGEADYIVIPSLFAKRTFLENGVPEGKVICIPYGVELDNFFPIPKDDRIFRIIHCGGTTVRKGVHYLLKAFYELNLPGSELWLIGTLNQEILPFFKKYNNGKVFMKGPYPQNDLYRYYSQGSVFCLASVEDGFGMVIFQAMACGLPAICSENTGGPDIIHDGENGFIIPIRNTEVLKEKLLYLYENQQICKAMGQEARKKILNGFTWNDYGAKMVQKYKEILNN